MSPPSEDHSFDARHFFLGPSTIDKMEDAQPLHSSVKSTSSRMTGAKHDESSSPSALETSITSASLIPATEAPKQVTTRLLGSSSAHAYDSQTDSRHIALGAIKLHRAPIDAPSDSVRWFMRSGLITREYPMPMFRVAAAKGWIKLEPYLEDEDLLRSRVHVYVIPEDVDRADRGPLKEFHKLILKLLEFLDRSEAAWHGTYTDTTLEEPYDVPLSENDESLFYIFNTLRSPSPNLDGIQHSIDGYSALYDVIHDKVNGLKTPLYSYQRRSVAAMVQRESEPAKLIDPRLVLTKDILGQPFYIDVHDGTLLKTPIMYTEPQGGILAETMGYGKTLICIALILATRGHYPKIPEHRVDDTEMQPQQKVGTLLNLAAQTTKHKGVAWKSHFNMLEGRGYHFDRCLRALSKYNRAYAEPIFNPTTPNRKGKRDSKKLIYLSYATLVIVPPNLIAQWQQEIHKHVENDGFDVLLIDSPARCIPSWQELLTYDIVLMTKSRFEQEYRDDDLNQGRRGAGEARYESPLTQLRWLRVICDEGHGFAGSSCKTNAMAMLDKMYIERRWVVSGTPSSTLHGAEVGLTTTSSTSSDDITTLSDSEGNARRSSISLTLKRRMIPEALSSENKDLERLRIIVVRFLQLRPWANQKGVDNADWKTYLAPVDNHGSRRVPIALREVLQTLIIRHRIEDIDTDLALPPLHTKVVYLKPSYHDKLSLNMFVMQLVSNYVTSEREDQDYMFHPKNRKKLDVLVNNLRNATFHWVGFTEESVRATQRISDEYLNENIDKVTDNDGLLLTEAIINAQQALDDPSWMAFSKLHEIGVFVDQFPGLAKAAWALDGEGRCPTLLGTTHARGAQSFFTGQVAKGIQDPLAGCVGRGMKVLRAAWDGVEKEQNQKSKMSSADREMQRQLGTTEEPRLRVTGLMVQKMTSKEVSPKNANEAKQSTKRKRTETLEDSSVIESETVQRHVPIELPPTTVIGFTSSKLAYLMSQLLTHSQTSKSIVFYASNNIAYWTAEALELLKIPFLIYANTLSVAQRSKYLMQFNSDDNIRVLLMDLKQASHGLHIASANRVYTISPIWDKAVESQAIKRAHRIGQTKEVFVETLVLEGTFEEEMIKRRQDIDRYGRDRADSPDSPATTSIMDLDGHTETNPPAASESTDTDNARLHERKSKCPTRQNTPHDYTTKSRRRPPPLKSHLTVQQRSQSLLDDSHMVQVLKNIKFLRFTQEECDSAAARVATLDVEAEKRMFFTLPKRADADAVTCDLRDGGEAQLDTIEVTKTVAVHEPVDRQRRDLGDIVVVKKARFV